MMPTRNRPFPVFVREAFGIPKRFDRERTRALRYSVVAHVEQLEAVTVRVLEVDAVIVTRPAGDGYTLFLQSHLRVLVRGGLHSQRHVVQLDVLLDADAHAT